MVESSDFLQNFSPVSQGSSLIILNNFIVKDPNCAITTKAGPAVNKMYKSVSTLTKLFYSSLVFCYIS